MALSFTVPDEVTANLLRLVAAYSGVETQPAVSSSAADVEFSAEGVQAFGEQTACKYIASKGHAAEQLLGSTPEQQAKIAEWLSFRRTALRPLMDARLADLNAALAGVTYVAGGTQPSLADLVLYAAISPAAVAFPVAQHGHFCNLLRWYDQLHHTADGQRLFPAATFARLRYVAPPPPAPAEKKETEGKGDNGKADGKADGKAAGKGGDKAAAAAAPAASGSGDKKGKGTGKEDVAAAGGDAAAAGGKKEKGKGKEGKGAAPATPAASGEAAAKKDDDCTVDLLDIRVGQVVKVGRHPNAEALYLEEIDLGEEQPRQVVSGLVKFVPQEQMEGRRVVVVCNLKPAKMRDVMSYGMVLCASNEAHDQVDPVIPPEGVPVGERITFEGFNREPEAQLNPKKKQFERIAPDLRVDANGLCVYRGVPMMTSKGAVTATIPNAWVK
ncbi:hypothetical protein ABPG75_003333 [Micractinium tetrahymenae]